MKPLQALDPYEPSSQVNGNQVKKTFLSTSQTAVSYTVSSQPSKPFREVFSTEFHINDVPVTVRNLLTKTVTLEEISCSTGTIVTCQGSYIPPEVKDKFPSVKPLHLLLQASKKQNIDCAVQRINILIQQAMNLPKYKEKVLIGLESAPPSFDVRGKVLGPGGANLQYITNETGALVTLRGRGSGFIEPTSGMESIEPLHLCVEHNKYDVLQAGRQLAFNLIETVQQEWYNCQQQQSSQAPPMSHPNQVVQSSSTTGTSVVGECVYSTAQIVSMPPPPSSTVTTSVPPPLLTVPPPSHHVLPPPPAQAPHHSHTLQLATSLNQLVQGPPPQIQPNLGQSNSTGGGLQSHAAQGQQVVSSTLAQVSSSQAAVTSQATVALQPLTVTSGVLQPGQSQALLQSQTQALLQGQSQGLLHQGHPSQTLLHQTQASQALLQQSQQTQALLQHSQASQGLLQQAQPVSTQASTTTLQEIPAHMYAAAAGNSGQMMAPNILTQQVIPQASIITQQPQIITQASYPLQYMQGGQMVVYGGAGGGAMRTSEGAGGGVMLLQYGGTGGAAGTAGRQPQQLMRPLLQPQIVQLVNPQTGQIQHVIQHVQPQVQLTSSNGGSVPQLLLPQPQLIAAPHHLQFAHISQPQPIHILGSTQTQSLIPVSTSGSANQVVVSSSQHQTQIQPTPQLVAVRPQPVTLGQKRRYDTETMNGQPIQVSGVSEAHSSSPQPAKKGVGDELNTARLRESQPLGTPTNLLPNQTNSKMLLTSSESDELERHSSQHQQQTEVKVDSAKRGRTGPGECDGIGEGAKDKVVYSYGGKPLMVNRQQGVMCSLVDGTSHQSTQVSLCSSLPTHQVVTSHAHQVSAAQTTHVAVGQTQMSQLPPNGPPPHSQLGPVHVQQFSTPPPPHPYAPHQTSYYQQPPPPYPPYNSWSVAPPPSQ